MRMTKWPLGRTGYGRFGARHNRAQGRFSLQSCTYMFEDALCCARPVKLRYSATDRDHGNHGYRRWPAGQAFEHGAEFVRLYFRGEVLSSRIGRVALRGIPDGLSHPHHSSWPEIAALDESAFNRHWIWSTGFLLLKRISDHRVADSGEAQNRNGECKGILHTQNASDLATLFLCPVRRVRNLSPASWRVDPSSRTRRLPAACRQLVHHSS